MTTIGDVVTQVAQHYGLDPILALACGWIESGLNATEDGDWTLNGVLVEPNTEGAVPTSFGLYQLHMGGELGNLTPAQAKNPTTNAVIALGTFAVMARQTGLTGGALAAAAQRPANPARYALDVDVVILQIVGGRFPEGYIESRDVDAGVPDPFPPAPPIATQGEPMFITHNPGNPGAEFVVSGSRKMPVSNSTEALVIAAQKLPALPTITQNQFDILVPVPWGTF